jgi:hypothetical protein
MCVVLAMTVLGAAGSASGVVVCVGDDGHVAVVTDLHPLHQSASADAHKPSVAADHESCGGCVDLHIDHRFVLLDSGCSVAPPLSAMHQTALVAPLQRPVSRHPSRAVLKLLQSLRTVVLLS